MCGIVGMVGDLPYNYNNVIKEMLVMDSVRGYDSTGFYAVGGGGIRTQMYKEATNGANFVHSRPFETILNDKAYFSAVVGHNRWATVGNVTSRNAHPFKCGSDVLVHSGSLTWWKGLKGADTVEVDSEAILTSSVAEGFEKTISGLYGSYALAYYNHKEKTLNLARNSQRPLWIAYSKDFSFAVFSSDKYILLSAVTRNKLDMEEPWLLKEHTIMSFDLQKVITEGMTNRTVTYKGYTPDTRSYTTPAKQPNKKSAKKPEKKNSQSGGNTPIPPTNVVDLTKKRVTVRANTESETSKAYKDRVLKEMFGLMAGQLINVCPTKFKSISSTSGFIEGEILDTSLDSPWHPFDTDNTPLFRMFNVDIGTGKAMVKRATEDSSVYQLQVESIQEVDSGKTVYVTGSFYRKLSNDESMKVWGDIADSYVDNNNRPSTINKKMEEPADTQVQEEEETDSLRFCGPNGGTLNKQRYLSLVQDGCAMCSGHISLHNHRQISWVFQDRPLCPDCTENYSAKAKEFGTSIEDYITQ